MEEPVEIAKTKEAKPERTRRPILLTLISLFSFVFFGFIAILFLLALFNAGWITDVLNKYLPENGESHLRVFMYILAGFLLHASSFAGTVMIWFMKKKGYMLFAVSGLIITSYQLFQSRISFMTTGVYIFLIILFGIFYKKLR
jgi:uncharacterized Tic20 family protein